MTPTTPTKNEGLRHRRVVMLLENHAYPQDPRVRAEAESLTSAGYEVLVVAPRRRGQDRSEKINGVTVRRFRHIEAAGRGAVGYLLEYLVAFVALHLAAIRALRTGADVLHIHNPPDFLWPAGALFRAAGRFVIFDHHDLFPETADAKFRSPLAARAARLFERLTYRNCDHVLATNESFAEMARIRGGKTDSAITIVRNGPPDTWLTLATATRSGKLDSVSLGYLGAISSQDGVEGLADVLPRVIALGVDATLTVIGDGDRRHDVEEAFERAGVADRVTFTGFVDRDQVPGLIAATDICVDPAPPSEVNHRSTMIKIGEYLALGKPVVAYDLVETNRTAGGAAVLVRPGDTAEFATAIAGLAVDPELRARVASEGRRRAAELTWSGSEKALLEVYGRPADPDTSPRREAADALLEAHDG